MKKLEFDGLTDMSDVEMQQTEGGFPPAAAFVAAAGAGLCFAGFMVVGCAVGYGLYKLAHWATT